MKYIAQSRAQTRSNINKQKENTQYTLFNLVFCGDNLLDTLKASPKWRYLHETLRRTLLSNGRCTGPRSSKWPILCRVGR